MAVKAERQLVSLQYMIAALVVRFHLKWGNDMTKGSSVYTIRDIEQLLKETKL